MRRFNTLFAFHSFLIVVEDDYERGSEDEQVGSSRGTEGIPHIWGYN